MKLYIQIMEAHRKPQNCACFNLRAATRFLTRRYDELLAPSGLLSTQYSMLTFIAEHTSCGVAELADWLDMDISTVTRNLRPLISAGHVTMRSGSADKRRREIRATAKGRRILDLARPLWNDAQDALARQLGTQRYAQLLDLLSAIRTPT